MKVVITAESRRGRSVEIPIKQDSSENGIRRVGEKETKARVEEGQGWGEGQWKGQKQARTNRCFSDDTHGRECDAWREKGVGGKVSYGLRQCNNDIIVGSMILPIHRV